MKKNIWIKVVFITTLLLSFALGNSADAANQSSIGDGTYTVGQDISVELSKLSISKGAADISIKRGDIELLSETLDGTQHYSPNQVTASLENGDKIEVLLHDGAANISVQEIPELDLTQIPGGFYEIGVDIPEGTYTIKSNNDEGASIDILDSQYNKKDSIDVDFAEAVDQEFSKGDKIYLYGLTGTVNFEEEIVVPQSISLNKSSLSLKVNKTASLTATVQPSTAENKEVSWSSSDPKIATVDQKGNVKALKAGKATITATAKGDDSVKKSIPVTVTKVIPTELKLSKSTLNIAIKQTYKVNATVTPADAANKSVVWKSSNAKVATVDSKGNIKGIASGSATITATTKDNPKVSKKVAVKVSPKTVKLDKTSLSLIAGKTATLKATVSPSDSTDKGVTWKSSNTKIATVNSKGKVTGKSKGTATITATAKGAKSAQAKVTIKAPIAAKSIKLNKKSATLNKGKSLTLTATISPKNTTNKTVTWKSSNTKVATVNSKGKVTAKGAGTAKITAKTSNGKTATATITVPYVKNLSAGTWKAGTDIPAGRYLITTKSGSGNLVITMKSYDRFVNEILSSKDDGFGVTRVATDIKAGDKIEIMGLNSVQFTRVKNVKSNTLHAGYWTVGKDISPGKYKITTPSGNGNLIVHRGSRLLVNEILTNKSDGFGVKSVTTTLKSGDKIQISSLNKVNFTKK